MQHIGNINHRNMEEKNTIRIVQEPKKAELVQACYGIIGAMIEVYKQLGAGLPEYIYQEALTTELISNGFNVHKELEYHPIYKGKEMKAFLKWIW